MTPAPEPFLDQPQDPSVRDPVLKELQKPRLVEAPEEIADVRVEHPVHLLPLDPDRERIQRIMRAAPRPEPVGETEEVHLVDRVQHLDDGPLDDLVLQRGDTERPKPPVRLRDVQLYETASPGTRPCAAVRAGRGGSPPAPARMTATSPRPPQQRPSGSTPGRPPAGDRQSTWCRSAVNRASLSFRAARRTRSSSLDAPCPALCPGRVLLAVFPSGSPLPSTASAAGDPALFGGFAGTTGLSDFP